jgi:hypothetical protein
MTAVNIVAPDGVTQLSDATGIKIQGGGGGGGAVTIADGADATQGITTGAAIITDAAGTIQQYARGLALLLGAATDTVNAWLKVSLATALDRTIDSVTNYPAGHSDTVIVTATTTTVKSGAGVARKVWVAGGTLGNVSIFDSLTGSGTSLFPAVTPAANAVLLEDVAFGTGLTIVTAAATIVVAVWR